MLKRYRDSFEKNSQSKRPRISHDNFNYSERPSERPSEHPSERPLLALESNVEFVRQVRFKLIQPTDADITYRLLQIHAYLFDPKLFEKSRRWVNNKIARNEIQHVIFFFWNTISLLENQNNGNLDLKYTPQSEFLKEMLQSIINGLNNPNRSGWKKSRLLAVRNILYSLFFFVDTGFVSKDIILAVHDCIVKLLEMACRNINEANPGDINNVVYNLAELAGRESLRESIDIQSLNILLKGFIAKIDEATSKDTSNIVFYLGKLATEGGLMAKSGDDAKISIIEIRYLLETLISRRNIYDRGNKKRINSYDIANIIYGLGCLARSNFLSGVVDIIQVNLLLEMLVARINEDPIDNITKMISGLGRLAAGKQLQKAVPNALININHINSLLLALVKRQDEVIPLDISDTLYWLSELAWEGYLKSEIDIKTINSLLEIFDAQLDKLDPLSISRVVYGLGELARKSCFCGQINVDSINSLLEELSQQCQAIVNKRGKLKPYIISNTVGGLSLLVWRDHVSSINIGHIKTLFKLFIELKNELKAQEIINMIHSLGRLANSKCLGQQRIDITGINSLLEILVMRSNNLESTEIETILRSLVTLAAKGWLKEKVNGQFILALSKMYKKGEKGPDNSLIDELKKTGIWQEDEIEGRAEIVLSPPIASSNTEMQPVEETMETQGSVEEVTEGESESQGSVEEMTEEGSESDEESEIEDRIWGGTDIFATHEEEMVEQAQIEDVPLPIDERMGVEDIPNPVELTEDEMLDRVYAFIANDDMDGLNEYLDLSRHCCHKEGLPSSTQTGYSGSDVQTTVAMPVENEYDGIIKRFFEEHCNEDLVKGKSHGCFISLLKMCSQKQFYQLCRDGRLTPLILHLPVEELYLFIRDCVGLRRLQQDSDSVLAVLDALCQCYEKNCSDKRFLIERSIKHLMIAALKSHRSHHIIEPILRKYSVESVMPRLKEACVQTISTALEGHNVNRVNEQVPEPKDELEIILTLLYDLTQPLQELIETYLDKKKQEQLGEGTTFHYISITWVLSMVYVYLQLEKQVADYQQYSSSRNSGATAQCAFFAADGANRAVEMQALKSTLSRLGAYVEVYRKKCEKRTGHGIISTDRLGGRISQCYRDYEESVARIELQRASPSVGMRMSV